MAQLPSCQAELLDSPMAASFIRSVNVGQNESDTKEFHKNLNFFISLFQRSLFKPFHQDCHGQLLGAGWWSTGTALHLILFRCCIGPGADEVIIVLSDITGIGKICPKIGSIIVCVHQSKYSVCDSSSCCRCLSRCCRYSASCSMSGVFLLFFFIALSIRKCIDDVDTLLIAVHHDLNLLAADGGQSLIDVLCTVF